MDVRQPLHSEHVKLLDTAGLRRHFLVERLVLGRVEPLGEVDHQGFLRRGRGGQGSFSIVGESRRPPSVTSSFEMPGTV